MVPFDVVLVAKASETIDIEQADQNSTGQGNE